MKAILHEIEEAFGYESERFKSVIHAEGRFFLLFILSNYTERQRRHLEKISTRIVNEEKYINRYEDGTT
ncbi:hypothetical protein ABEX00_07060 [Bacillus safensis]|uniref:hypothetical protein n=1 Tax=Bacillus sp. FSL K6-1000 TaxID=2921458 RepID=UPI003159E38A